MNTLLKSIAISLMAMLFLVGCGGSSDKTSDTNNTSAATTEPITKFTPELLVGYTYNVILIDGTSLMTFGETTFTYIEEGETFTENYEIDEDGAVIMDGNSVQILLSIEDNGDLRVLSEGTETVLWVKQ